MASRTLRFIYQISVVALLLSLNHTAAAKSQKNIMFVLDASNSMWGQIDGKAKIDIAKSALIRLVAKMPLNAKLGLVAYGHRFDRKLNECDDMELMNPIGHFSSKEVANSFQFITPKGQTPIARTLRETALWLEQYKGENNIVVLITDGLESCKGDPCAAAKALNDAGITTSIHVVGFDLTSAQRKKIRCISDNGNGQYLDAKNAEGLVAALDRVKTEVSAPEPIPVEKKIKKPAPKSEIYFKDDFDSDALADHWEVVKANTENYIVEGGKLTVLFVDGKKPTHVYKNATNIFRLKKPVPKGDWVMTARFLSKPQTHGEWIRFGLSKDGSTSLFASLSMTALDYVTTSAELRADKTSNDKVTSFATSLLMLGDRDLALRTAKFGLHVKAYQVRLTKKGRSYVVSGRMEAADPTAKDAVAEGWTVLQKLTSLRVPGDAFTMMFGNTHNHPSLPYTGEGLVEIDWIKVEQ